VFDFDGTLADTFTCIAASVDVALSDGGFRPADRELLRSAVGLSLPTVFDVVTGGGLGSEAIRSLVARYRSAFAEVAASAVTLFPGVRKQLEVFGGAGVQLAVATSKSRRAVAELLDGLGIAGLFAVVVADDMVVRKKPDREMLDRVSAMLEVAPGASVMIGDAEYDIVMGRAAGYRTCAVTWGNQSRDRLARQQPDHIVDTPEQLAPTLLQPRGGPPRS
jgi:phosphoglycolate phosphatase